MVIDELGGIWKEKGWPVRGIIPEFGTGNEEAHVNPKSE
jgi:hypothetical protein